MSAIAVGMMSRPGRHGMGLTRRGRLVLSVGAGLMTLALVVAIAWQAVAGTSASGHSQQVVVVESGQTLSHLAAEHLPEFGQQEGVLKLQVANDLGTSAVQSGQEIIIP